MKQKHKIWYLHHFESRNDFGFPEIISLYHATVIRHKVAFLVTLIVKFLLCLTRMLSLTQNEDTDEAFCRQPEAISKSQPLILLGGFNYSYICWRSNTVKNSLDVSVTRGKLRIMWRTLVTEHRAGGVTE